MTVQPYHPDSEINSGVMADANEAEIVDVQAGFAPRWWQCGTCGSAHNRGFMVGQVGVHRCFGCGYAGTFGYYHDENPNGPEMVRSGVVDVDR